MKIYTMLRSALAVFVLLGILLPTGTTLADFAVPFASTVWQDDGDADTDVDPPTEPVLEPAAVVLDQQPVEQPNVVVEVPEEGFFTINNILLIVTILGMMGTLAVTQFRASGNNPGATIDGLAGNSEFTELLRRLADATPPEVTKMIFALATQAGDVIDGVEGVITMTKNALDPSLLTLEFELVVPQGTDTLALREEIQAIIDRYAKSADGSAEMLVKQTKFPK